MIRKHRSNWRSCTRRERPPGRSCFGTISIKKRIIAAVVLIAAILAAFYILPRWWQTRPRLYKAGYDRAVAALRKEFGDAAVDRGIVSIPKVEVSVPFRGFAIFGSYLAGEPLIVHLDGSAAAVVMQSDGGLQAATVPPELAREVWAALLYVHKTQCKGDNALAAGDEIGLPEMNLADRTWPLPQPQPAPTGDSRAERNAASSDALRRVLVRRLAAEFLTTCGIRLSSEKDVVLPVVRRMVGQSTPPLDEKDEALLRRLGDTYASMENADGLRLLKKLSALRSREKYSYTLQRYYRTPIIGGLAARFDRWRSRSSPRVYITVAGDIWRIEKLDGKPDEEVFKILCETAFPPPANGDAPDYTILKRAREILCEKWPDKWKDLLVEHYTDLGGNLESFLPSEGAEGAGDEKFVRKVLDGSPRGELRAKALASLYMITKDRAPVAELESLARNNTSTDPRGAVEAARKLMAIYAEDKTACDAPAIVVHVLDAMAARLSGADEGDKVQQAPVGSTEAVAQSQEEVREARWDLVSDLDGRGPEYAPILARLLVSQETGPGAAGSDDSRVLTYAVNALSGWPIEGVEAFGKYLETARADSEIACSIVDALCLMGAADGLTVLQKAEGLTLPLPKDEGGADSPPEPFDVRVHRAEVYIKVRNAADPVAAFRALPPADRKVLFGWQLAATFTKEDLQAFLLDGICADTPERLLAAFYWRDARSHLSQKCLECKDKCETIRRLFPPGSQPPAPQPALTSSR